MTTSAPPVAEASYPTAPQHPHHHLGVVLVVLAAVVALVGTTLLGVGSLVFGQKPVRADRAQLETALGTAAVAQEAHLAEHGRFTTWRNDLVATGWAPENAVNLRLVSATATTYCMAAGPVSGEPVMWRTPAGASDEPCG